MRQVGWKYMENWFLETRFSHFVRCSEGRLQTPEVSSDVNKGFGGQDGD